jgi:hypothetical protein
MTYRYGRVAALAVLALVVASGARAEALLPPSPAAMQMAQYYPPPRYNAYPPPGYYPAPRPPCNVAGGAFVGAGRGAAGGAVIGAIAGNAGRGAAIGAGVGLFAGAARRAAARDYGYCY